MYLFCVFWFSVFLLVFLLRTCFGCFYVDFWFTRAAGSAVILCLRLEDYVPPPKEVAVTLQRVEDGHFCAHNIFQVNVLSLPLLLIIVIVISLLYF